MPLLALDLLLAVDWKQPESHVVRTANQTLQTQDTSTLVRYGLPEDHRPPQTMDIKHHRPKL